MKDESQPTVWDRYRESISEEAFDSVILDVVSMTDPEEQLAAVSKLTRPRGCNHKHCYGRGYVGKVEEGLINCPRCTEGYDL